MQFRLRTSLTILTIGCILLAPRVNRAHRDRRALDLIRQVPCKNLIVYYDYHEINPTGGADILQKPPEPEWLRRLLGDEYLMRIEQVYLRGPKVADIHLRCLEPLVNDLHGLSLHSSSVTSDGLAYLAKFRALRRLDLGQIWPRISRGSIPHLLKMSELRYLSLLGADVSDNDIQWLSRLEKLEILDLGYTKVTPNGIHRLHAALPNCEVHWDSGRFDYSENWTWFEGMHEVSVNVAHEPKEHVHYSSRSF